VKSFFWIFLLSFSGGSIAIKCKGHVAFLNLAADGSENENFDYYYDVVKDRFHAAGISTFYHNSTPNELSGCFGKVESASLILPKSEYGYVFIMSNNTVSSIDGTLTDIDLIDVIRTRFSLTSATNK
jgi:hypothetical protein